MKICWDNLEKIWFTKNGNFNIGKKGQTYYERVCIECDEMFLGRIKSEYCSNKCKYNSSIKKRKISDSMKKTLNSPEGKQKVLERTRRGDKNNHWKGGVTANNISLYDTYAPRLEPYEKCRRNIDNTDMLEVKCTYCGKWYIPTIINVSGRISGINNNDRCRFYCSDSCKYECPMFGKQKYYKGQQGHKSREAQPELRQLVFARDEYICIKCGSNEHLHCHHIDPIINNPIESADIDNCITLCKCCHKKIHMQNGCKYNELKGCA